MKFNSIRFFSKLTFRAKIGLGTVGIVIFATLVSGLPANRMAAKALMEESKKRGQALALSVAMNAVEPVLSLNLLRLKNMVDQIKSVDPDIDYAFIMDNQGQVLASTFHRGFPVQLRKANKADFSASQTHIQLLDTGTEKIYDFATPIMVGKIAVGTVRIGLSRNKIEQQINRFLLAMAALALGALVVAIFLGALFSQRISKRINLLRLHAESLVTGDLELETPSLAHANCWEINSCNLKQCPAHGDYHRRCWYLAGTLCPQCDQKQYPQKLRSCRSCPVFAKNRGDEIQDLADTFDVMALSLQNHIRELQKADQEIRHQERLLRTVLDVTPDLVSLQDKNMIYQAVNKGFANFVGRTPRGIAGLGDSEIFADNGLEILAQEVRDILKTGRQLQKEVRLGVSHCRRKRECWLHVVLTPVMDQNKNIVGVLRTMRDISDMKQVQAQLIQAQKMESLGKLAGGVAHEINTPLGIILGYAQLLQEDFKEGDQVREDLKAIEKQAKVCRQIVSDLLGFSRQAQSAKLEMCFNNSLMEAVTLVRHTFKMDKVNIVTELDDRLPIIYGDPEKLKQVWINLLNNARDAMPAGGDILVTSKLDYKRLVVTACVADTGEGIAPEDLKKIFDPFFTTKSVGQGTGLGLSVSFGIIEDHEGSITAKSPVPSDKFDFLDKSKIHGPGTIFTVELPLDHSPEDD